MAECKMKLFLTKFLYTYQLQCNVKYNYAKSLSTIIEQSPPPPPFFFFFSFFFVVVVAFFFICLCLFVVVFCSGTGETQTWVFCSSCCNS